MDAGTGKRTYESPLRIAQAGQTRGRVLDAAAEAFARDGFAATSIHAVARSAGVSVETVYAAFGGKRGLLTALVDRAGLRLAAQRVRAAWAEREEDPAGQLSAMATLAGEYWSATMPLLRTMRRGTGDSALDGVWDLPQRGRRALFRSLLVSWPPGTLRAGLDPGAAADLLYALTSPDVYLMLTEDAGWSVDRYAAHVTDAACHQLLHGGGSGTAEDRGAG